MVRAEGYVESGPHDIEGEPHWAVYFPTAKYNKDGHLFVSIPEAALTAAGVDLGEGISNFSEGISIGRTPIIAAEVNGNALSPGELNPQTLEFVGFRPSLDGEGWWSRTDDDISRVNE